MTKTFLKGRERIMKGVSALAITAIMTSGSIIPVNVFADSVEKNVDEFMATKLYETAGNYDVDIERIDLTTAYVDDERFTTGISVNIDKSRGDKKYTKKVDKALKKNMKKITEYTSKEDLPGLLLSLVVSAHDEELGYGVVERDTMYTFVNLNELKDKEILNEEIKNEIDALSEEYESILIEEEGCKVCYHTEDHNVDHNPEEVLVLTKKGKVRKLRKYNNVELLQEAVTLVNEVGEVYDYDCSIVECSEMLPGDEVADPETSYFYIDTTEMDESKQLKIAQKYADKHNLGKLEEGSVCINGEDL